MVVHRLCSKTKVWNQGVGKKMMEFAERLAKKNNCVSIRLDTYINNPKAISFYKRLGYNQLGNIKLKPEKDIYYCFEKLLLKHNKLIYCKHVKRRYFTNTGRMGKWSSSNWKK